MPRIPKSLTDPIALRAIVDLRRAGWENREIAEALGISLRTVERRMTEIRQRYAGSIHLAEERC